MIDHLTILASWLPYYWKKSYLSNFDTQHVDTELPSISSLPS